MGGLSLQRKLAAQILKVGTNKVWIDQSKLEEVKNAITRADIKKMISHGYIRAKPDKISKPDLYHHVRKKNTGSRKGHKGSREPRKQKWMNTVRGLREIIKELRDGKEMERSEYRKLYLRVKSGAFRSRTHLKLYLKQRGLLNENKS